MTPPTPPPDLLTIPEVMTRLRISRSTVYRLIRIGELPSAAIGRARRIPARALTSFLNNLTTRQE